MFLRILFPKREGCDSRDFSVSLDFRADFSIYLTQFKLQEGVAGLVFEPQPPNFAKMHNFERCKNDTKMPF